MTALVPISQLPNIVGRILTTNFEGSPYGEVNVSRLCLVARGGRG